ncbi:nucleotidyltransferase [Fulvimarina endophytica]|uniref:Nucleotidyltransferase n=1 Tax=Fulvimarina endophytica TaxID=2293836 RepID=A0A371WY72_9HYPH|nr:nucleotidyltransferase family protein [Fulvimarina endophytica]RFC61950.1 nucleotidyltransferase [Fulvimarina endophytica]
MKPSEALDRHRETIREILSRYPVANPRVFGSVARGEDGEESDLDILVEFLASDERAPTFTYFDLARMEIELTRKTGVRVDIRLENGFPMRTRERIGRGAVPL